MIDMLDQGALSEMQGRGIIGTDSEGMPIYGSTSKPETGKSFNDAIKDLFWDVLGREPSPRELSIYRRDFGEKIDPSEEQIFFDRSQQEIQGRNDPILDLFREATGGREPTFEEYRATRKELGGDISAEERAEFLENYVDPAFKEQYNTLSPSDPVYRLFSQELRRKPTLQEYRQFQGMIGGTPTDEQRMAVRASDRDTYKTRVLDQYRYMTEGYGPPPDQMSRLEASPERYNIENIGADLAKSNLHNRQRYASSVAPMFGGAYDPATRADYRFAYQDPFTQFFAPTQSQAPRLSQTMKVAGQQYYQKPTSLGANYIGAPTNIAPITQGFQPVGMPSTIGGKGGFQFQPPSRGQEPSSREAPPEGFQPMGGKGVPRAITGKGG